jgi:CHAT domain-containing protein/tetratricopeptide (TPR) repeat protein
MIDSPNVLSAEQEFAEAEKLSQQESVSAKRQAITKYQAALSRWQTAGDQAHAVQALQGIASTHSSLGEFQAAIERLKAALAILPNPNDLTTKASLLLSLGIQYNSLNEGQPALAALHQVQAIYAAQPNPLGIAFVLISVGSAHTKLGNLSSALMAYEQAYTTFQAEKLYAYETQSLNSIANLYYQKGNTQKALAVYSQSLALGQSNQDIAGQISILESISQLYLEIGQPQKAVDQLLAAIALHQQQNDIFGQALTLGQLSMAYAALGDIPKLQETRQQVLQLQQAIQSLPIDPNQPLPVAQLAGIYAMIATTYSLSESAKAIDLYTQALAILRASENQWIEGQILSQMATVYDTAGEKQKALDALHQALSIYQARQDRAQTAIQLRDLAMIYASLGEYQTALDHYQQALTLQQQIGNQPKQALTLRNVAQLYGTLGDYTLSLENYSQALALFQSIENRSQEALTLNQIGALYRDRKQGTQALDYYTQALPITEATGEFAMTLMTLSSMVKTYRLLEDSAKALETANYVLKIARDRGDKFYETSALSLLGGAYLSAGDYLKGIEVITQAIQNWRQLGIRDAEVNALHILGNLYTKMGQYQLAIDTYQQELALTKVLSDPVKQADALYEIAVTESLSGNLSAAKSSLELTLETVEDLRVQVISPELRTSYFATVQRYYHAYIDLLMQLHKQQPQQGFDALALHVNERDRARSLLDLLTEAKINIRAEIDPQLLQQETALKQKLSALESQRIAIANSAAPNEAELKILDQQTYNLLTQYRELQTQIRQASPQYTTLTQPQPLTLSEIQQQVLDPDTILVEYSLGEERSYLWIATQTSLTSHELPHRAIIEAAAQAFLSVIKNPKDTTYPEKIAAVAEPLSQMILSPFIQSFSQRRLLIVGDGILQYIPFATLPIWHPESTQPSPLVIDYETIILPSASAIAVLRQTQRDRALAAREIAIFADPVFSPTDERLMATPQPADPQTLQEPGATFDRLFHTRQEAQNILERFNTSSTKQLFDFQATRNAAIDADLANYKIIHFATHGVLNTNYPALSGVVLSLVDQAGQPQNGFLRLHDIFNLQLSAELVVLSACETALGQDKPGEGLLGLTRGFIYAGAARMVISLWPVNDDSTAELMTRFYQAMSTEHLSPAIALKQAQVEMLEAYYSPYDWAGFIIQGEWHNYS